MRSDLRLREQHIYLSNNFIRKWVLCGYHSDDVGGNGKFDTAMGRSYRRWRLLKVIGAGKDILHNFVTDLSNYRVYVWNWNILIWSED